LDFYEAKKKERYQTKGNYDNWDAAQKHLENYCSPHITFNDVDIDFIKGFKKTPRYCRCNQERKKLISKHEAYLFQQI
jgi:hypothetical protein